MEYTVLACAVIFGADESLLSVKLNNGLTFKRMSMIPMEDDLDSVFQISAEGLHRDYELARIDLNGNDENASDVICLYYSKEISLNKSDEVEYWRSLFNNEKSLLTQFDNNIRIIRLLKEGTVHFKRVAIHMQPKEANHKRVTIIEIGEAQNTKVIQKFSCTKKEIEIINKNISLIQFPLTPKILNSCHVYYDLSYHQPNHISLTLLIICLEMMFLNSENAKKVKLSKRCACFLYEDCNERIICFQKLKTLYEKRCKFVHDGEIIDVNDADIIYLRDCVRKSILKYQINDFVKSDVINNLKALISDLSYFNVQEKVDEI